MIHGQLFLSKVIDGNDPQALKRFNITAADMPTEAERQALKFIADYAEQNRGQAPSYDTVVTEVPGFDYMPNVESDYGYMAKKIKSHSIKQQIADFVNGKFGNMFAEENDGNKLFEDLQRELDSIKMRTSVRSKIGTDVKREGASFLDEYRNRKEGKSFKIWRSKFETINREIGGYMSGNMYTWHGRSGRGKSVFTMEELIEAATQGANVLVWAMEMSRFEWMARAYSSISAWYSGESKQIDGIDYEVGFENKALLMGSLSEGFERGLEMFAEKLPELFDGNIILRAADDEDFMKRGVDQLEADILATKADVVVVDPIYLMDYEHNTSRTAGGDVANTSKKIRRIAGYTNSCVHVVTQADEVKDDIDEHGKRELRAPKRAEIKKTKAVLEDAANVFGIDSLDGNGLIEIGKGRNGGEGTQVSVIYLPNYGIVREAPTGEAAASQFDF
jgi:hemerythrin-like domain-containing protein